LENQSGYGKNRFGRFGKKSYICIHNLKLKHKQNEQSKIDKIYPKV
jgi:hypothetical protein